MTPKTMLMPDGRARTAGAAAVLPSHAPAEHPPFLADEALAERPPLPASETPAELPPHPVEVPTIRPLAAAQVSTIRPAQPPAAAPLAAAEVVTAGLPPLMATPATTSSGSPGQPRAPIDPDVQISRIRLLEEHVR